MLNKKWIGIAVLASAAFTTTTFANDRGVNTALGAVLGAVIGNSVGGQNATVIGGVLGAVVGANLASNDDRYYNTRSQTYRTPTHYRRAPVRVQPRYQERAYRGRPVVKHDYREVRRVDYIPYNRAGHHR